MTIWIYLLALCGSASAFAQLRVFNLETENVHALAVGSLHIRVHNASSAAWTSEEIHSHARDYEEDLQTDVKSLEQSLSRLGVWSPEEIFELAKDYKIRLEEEVEFLRYTLTRLLRYHDEIPTRFIDSTTPQPHTVQGAFWNVLGQSLGFIHELPLVTTKERDDIRRILLHPAFRKGIERNKFDVRFGKEVLNEYLKFLDELSARVEPRVDATVAWLIQHPERHVVSEDDTRNLIADFLAEAPSVQPSPSMLLATSEAESWLVENDERSRRFDIRNALEEGMDHTSPKDPSPGPSVSAYAFLPQWANWLIEQSPFWTRADPSRIFLRQGHRPLTFDFLRMFFDSLEDESLEASRKRNATDPGE